MAKSIKPVKVADLLFDPLNPRLPEDVEKTQKAMFRFIVREIGVADLLDSIGSSGVIAGDPIICRLALEDEVGNQEKASEASKTPLVERYFVIEGNRRLAALKILNGEKLEDGEEEFVIPQMSAEEKKSIIEVNVELGWDSEKLEAYLGYKHVTSSREWTPEAKARFVVVHCSGNYSPENLDKFAKRLGTKVPILRRWLVAYLTLKEAEAKGLFSPTQAYAKRYFGSFYTLLGSQEVQNLLGLSSHLIENPVPQEKLDNLKDFIDWTIGTKKSPPIINSRSQKKLDAVLASPSALRHFRAKKNLDSSLLYTEYNSEEIAIKLEAAAYTIEECLSKLFDVRDDSRVIAAIEQLESAYEKLKINSQTGATERK
jgi:hypothetical protein